jgi:intracellular proteinase inhibitor BsuPI
LAPQARKRASSPVSVAVTLIVLAVMAVLGMAALNREAVGEPIVPEQISHLFNKSDPALPVGLNYDLSMINPDTQQSTDTLPQLGAVELRLAITNDTALPMTLKFPTSLQCEFTVRRIYSFLGGLFVVPLEVWRSSYFHNVEKKSSQLRLQPGQTKVYTADWSVNGLNQLEVPPGDYRVYTSFEGIKPLFVQKPI